MKIYDTHLNKIVFSYSTEEIKNIIYKALASILKNKVTNSTLSSSTLYCKISKIIEGDIEITNNTDETYFLYEDDILKYALIEDDTTEFNTIAISEIEQALYYSSKQDASTYYNSYDTEFNNNTHRVYDNFIMVTRISIV